MQRKVRTNRIRTKEGAPKVPGSKMIVYLMSRGSGDEDSTKKQVAGESVVSCRNGIENRRVRCVYR